MGTDGEKEAGKKAKAEPEMTEKGLGSDPPLPASELPTVIERPQSVEEMPTVVTRDLPLDRPWYKNPNWIKAMVGILALGVVAIGLVLTKTGC